ncbi:alpha/beta hydrolase [Segniliparus rugosus]|nr:alpha/beta hydrolase [Segniliparus rugosus]
MHEPKAQREGTNSVGRSTAVVETVTTRLGTRLFHDFLRATFRRSFDLVARAYDRNIMTQGQILRFCGRVNKFLPKVLLPPLPGTRLRPVDLQDFRAEWVWGPGIDDPGSAADPAAVLYLHGGGLLIGGLRTHRGMVARVARGCGAPVLNVEYRQIPHGARIEDTLEDCFAAYRLLLAEGIPAERIVLAGDSVGAGLCFFLALSCRERGLPAPRAIAAISPFAEFDLAEKLAHPNNKSEGFCSADVYSLSVRWAVESAGGIAPGWSLRNRDFSDLPPVFLQVGSHEVLRLDSELIVERCQVAGVPVKLQIWDRALHDFHMDAHIFPDGFDAIDEFSSFIRNALHDAPGAGRWF